MTFREESKHCIKEQKIQGVVCYPCSICGVIYESSEKLKEHILAWDKIQDD